MEEQQPKRRGRPPKAKEPAGSAPAVLAVPAPDHHDGAADQGAADTVGQGKESDWPALILRAMEIHTPEMPVYQIHGHKPPREFVAIGNNGATLIEGEPAIITADGTRH